MELYLPNQCPHHYLQNYLYYLRLKIIHTTNIVVSMIVYVIYSNPCEQYQIYDVVVTNRFVIPRVPRWIPALFILIC